MSHGEITIEMWPLTEKRLTCPTCSGDGNRHAVGCSASRHRGDLERELVAGMRQHELETLREYRVLERGDDGHFLLECTANRCPVFFWLRRPADLPIVHVFESATYYRGKAEPDGERVIEHRPTGLCPGDWVRIANHVWEHRKRL
jgi:hypothetical protein